MTTRGDEREAAPPLTIRLAMPEGGTLTPQRRAAALANGVLRQLVRREDPDGRDVVIEVVEGDTTTTIATTLRVEPDARMIASLAAMPGVELAGHRGDAVVDKEAATL